MISWPAANEIRCVNPSIETVSPSRTSSPTASRIVVTLLELIPHPSVGRPAKDAELVALRVAHLGPERTALLDEAAFRGAEGLESLDLLGHRPRRTQIEMDGVLRRLRLGHRLEEDPARAAGGVAHVGAVRIHVGELEAERRRPEGRH